MLIIHLSLRNLLRHKRRNLMLLAAITVAVAFVSASNTLIRGFQFNMKDAAIANLTGHIKIHQPGYREDPGIARTFKLSDQFQPDVPAEQLLGWAPRILVPAVIMSERETRGVQLAGIDPQAEYISFLGSATIAGAALRDVDDDGVLIGAELARQLETRVGRRLVINAQGSDGLARERGFRIVGTYDADGTGLEKIYVFTGLSVVQNLLNSDGVTEVSVRLREEPASWNIKDRLLAAYSGLEVLDWRELQPQAAVMDMAANTAVFIWFALMMSALIFGLINTLIAAVMERIKEFGLLRAVGMRNGLVVLQVVIESTILMSIGVTTGLLSGYLIFRSLADGIDLSAFAEGMEGFGGAILTPILLPADMLLVALLSLGLGVIASLYPAWRAVKVPPLNAMHR